jgi:hypothetical protein
MTTAEAVNAVREIYSSGEKQVLKIAEEMLDIALDKGGFLSFSLLLLVVLTSTSRVQGQYFFNRCKVTRCYSGIRI